MTKEEIKVKNFQEFMLKLLSRSAFTEKVIRDMVTFKKGAKSEAYIKGYNSCNGENSLSQLAKIIGVTPSTLSPILNKWEQEGIVYIVEKRNGWFYKKLFSIG